LNCLASFGVVASASDEPTVTLLYTNNDETDVSS
jgi:hypothetical protein